MKEWQSDKMYPDQAKDREKAMAKNANKRATKKNIKIAAMAGFHGLLLEQLVK